jgi:hypothetical protein
MRQSRVIQYATEWAAALVWVASISVHAAAIKQPDPPQQRMIAAIEAWDAPGVMAEANALTINSRSKDGITPLMVEARVGGYADVLKLMRLARMKAIEPSEARESGKSGPNRAMMHD